MSFDRYVFSLDITGFTQSLTEPDPPARWVRVARAADVDNDTDHRHRLLLGAQRASRARSAQQNQQFATVNHSMTSSASSAKNVQNPSPSMGPRWGREGWG